MSAALRPSLDSAASDRLVSELEFEALLVTVAAVPLLDPSSSSFEPATPAMLPINAAVTATAAIFLTYIVQSFLGGRPPGHLLVIDRVGRERACVVTQLIRHGPRALKAAPFWSVAQVE